MQTVASALLVSSFAGAEERMSAVVSALSERFHLPEAEISRQLDAQDAAIKALRTLRDELGMAFGGAWYDPTSRQLAVGITDWSRRGSVERVGARATRVDRSEWRLQLVDRIAARAVADGLHASLTGGRVDYRVNQVVLDILPGREADVAEAWSRDVVDLAGVRFQPSQHRPVALVEISGGDGYANPAFGGCSVGFDTGSGFFTAAHCGRVGHAVTAGEPLGNFNYSALPTNYVDPELGPMADPHFDIAHVVTEPQWQMWPVVAPQAYYHPVIIDYQDGMIGLYVCRFGAASGGPHCGSIQGYNAFFFDARPATGNVITQYIGLIETSACGVPGDSGGPLIYPTLHKIWPGYAHAIGTLSGGVPGGCPNAQTTWYAPITRAIDLTQQMIPLHEY